MAMVFFSQIGLMLWKNWIIQRRRICVSIFEILLPLFFAALLLLFRAAISTDKVEDVTVYPIKPLNLNLSSNDFLKSMSYIGYTPEGTEINSLVNYMEQIFQMDTPGAINVTFKGFVDDKVMEEFYIENSGLMRLCVSFKNIADPTIDLPRNLDFAVRPFTGDERWRTRRTFDPVQSNKPRENNNDYSREKGETWIEFSKATQLYEGRGVLYLQRLVGEGLIKYWLNKTGGNASDVKLGGYTQRMAYPPYVEDLMIKVIQITLPLFLVLSFILNVIVNTKNLVYEKERKLKESMKLMGLKASVHWLSWFITFCIYLIPSLVLYTIFICANIIQSKGPIVKHSDGSLVFIFLLLYGFSLITFCFMVSSFVQKANVGAALSGILFFGTYLPHFYVDNNYKDLGQSSKLGFSLLFNCAVGLGAKVIGLYEGTGEGLQWDNFFEPATVDDNLSMFSCMLMLIVDSLWHLLIFWYLDNVRPGDFGVPKPFYFCFTKSYWCGGKTSRDTEDGEENGEINMRFEKEPTNLKAGIRIKNLKKVFGKKVAVEGLTLNMYEGQIFVMLGHNGAGKTTTMSMLTGFIPPSSGRAIVNDYDITENIDAVRSNLGLCPQHNVLFDGLTVKEHLQFFARLKGASNEEAEAEIGPLLNEVGLETKIFARSDSLSGGQKRKLSVAIALIAGSKIVILDEPSSGMDPAARRQTWNVLQNHREGCTMVLTTHYMDEADVLGDRIAIMAEGVVKCCGSSMFLKKLYGAGYHLIIVKDQSCNVDKLTKVVIEHMNTAKLETIINQEVSFLLPEKETATFPALFTELEMRRTELGIDSFGTSATTMEEVFLKVGNSASHHDDLSESLETGLNGFTNPALNTERLLPGDDPTCFEKNKVHSSLDNNELVDKSTDIMSFNKGFTKKTGLALEFNRMYALFVKKALHTWRNRTITLVQLLLPAIFTICGLAFDQRRPKTHVDLVLKFDLAKFDDTYIPTTDGLNPTVNDTSLRNFYDKQFSNDQTIEFANLTKYATYDNYTLKRVKDLGIGTFNKRVIVGLEVQAKEALESIHAISHYNGQPLHAEPIGVNYLMNALLRFYLNSSYSLQSSIDPLPMDEEERAKDDAELTLGGGFNIGCFVNFGMAFLTTLFIHYLIKERQVGAKHLQVVSGVNPFIYWIPTFLWDFVNFIIPSLLLLVIFACYQKTAYTGDERWLLVILLLVVYGWAMLPFMYVLQFAFREPPTGVVTVIMLNIVSGLACLLAVMILRIHSLDISEVCNYIFMVLLPNYSMAQGFVDVYTNYKNNKICEAVNCTINNPFPRACCKDKCGNLCFEHQSNYLSLDRPGIGPYIVCLAVQGFIFFTIVLLIEYNVLQKIWYFLRGSCTEPGLHSFENWYNVGDSDVDEERQRINSSPVSVLSTTDSLLLVNLFKQYGYSVAVDHICVGIPQQECFGLLGQNGAGKTSIFKMLTGDVMVTGGNAYLTGYDVRNNIKHVQANMGYCPQFDALIDQMTGRETLVMYARLRGVPEKNIKQVVNHLIDILMLRPHADKISGNYSGGNKRKLSMAIALVGDPQFIMLDEPSTGMDPKARRQLWTLLSQVRASGRTLVLTSHSMEECDALCTRIAIMVNGRFVCLGSPQHLKNKFGQGYTLIVQLGSLPNGNTAPIGPVIDFVCQNFPGTIVFDDHQGYIHLHVPDSTIKLANVFSLMESTKINLYVRDYSVHQTTLEQVFLTFTRSQIIST